MSHSADNTTSAEGPRLTLRQLQQLCTRVLDEVASEEESCTLNRVLANDPAARQVYLRHVALHSALHASTGKQKQAEEELLRLHIAQAVRDEDSAVDGGPAPAGADSLAEERPALAPAGSGLRVGFGTLLAIAASVMAIAIGGGLWMSSRPDSVVVSAAKDDADGSIAAARVSYLSNAAQTTIGKLTPQQTFAAGDTVSLAEGQVELTYRSGTKLLLIGPADFVVEKEGGALRCGGLVASVTEAGHGFTIETPNGKVVDLGTEFGVAVDDLGVSEVSVFDGKVEAFPGSDAGAKIELTKGHGLQWDQENLVELDADLRRFATSVLEYANLGGKAVEHPLLIDSFSQNNLDANRWKSLGNVSSTDGSLRMRGQGVADERPYLVAAAPLDMSLGAVTVTCDFRFKESPNGNAPSLAIFSRGADSRGIALQPWRGMLASGVRCALDSDPQSGQATLRAGVKLESNREVTEVASTSLPALRPGVPYRVVMRDDGVNVSLTLSERDAPQSAKTVRCRSLFRGAQNHVAFEGGVDGVTLIESVAISQSSSAPAFPQLRRPLFDPPERAGPQPDRASPLGFARTGGRPLANRRRFRRERARPRSLVDARQSEGRVGRRATRSAEQGRAHRHMEATPLSADFNAYRSNRGSGHGARPGEIRGQLPRRLRRLFLRDDTGRGPTRQRPGLGALGAAAWCSRKPVARIVGLRAQSRTPREAGA